MTYLDIAKSVQFKAAATKDLRARSTDGQDEHTSGYERNESDEKSPALLKARGAERLKALIITALDVEPEAFDRETYNRLITRWNARGAAGAGNSEVH
jgi:hypothetical protein